MDVLQLEYLLFCIQMKVMVHVHMYHTCDYDNNTHVIWDMERVKTRNREVVEVKWWDLFCLKIERRLDLALLVDWLRLCLTVVSTAVLNEDRTVSVRGAELLGYKI